MSGQTKIVLPLQVSSLEEFRTQMKKGVKDFDYFELWVDYLPWKDGALLGELRELFLEHAKRLILLTRRLNLESPVLTTEQQRGILALAAEHSVLVDFDFVAQRSLLNVYQKDFSRGISPLLSYHNYDDTPKTEELLKIAREMSQEPHEYVKLATFCKTRTDALRLLLVQEHIVEENPDLAGRCIFLGMGEPGLVTRIFGPLYGAPLTFLSLKDSKKTAPGQLSVEEYRGVVGVLGVG